MLITMICRHFALGVVFIWKYPMRISPRIVVALLAAVIISSCSAGVQPLAPGAAGGRSDAARASGRAPSSFPLELANSAIGRRPMLVPRSEASGATSTAAVYVSDFISGTVTVFSTSGAQTKQVTGFNYPKGLTGDSLGNVYVVDQGVSTVYKYSAGLTTLELTMPVIGYNPTDVAVAPSGVVAVTSGTSTSGGSGSATFFAKGNSKPCATVTSANWLRVYFGSFDDNGNLYVGAGTSTATY